jgi:hypothetical protein
MIAKVVPKPEIPQNGHVEETFPYGCNHHGRPLWLTARSISADLAKLLPE